MSKNQPKIDHMCSAHLHRIKDELFYIHSGKIKLLWTDDKYTIEDMKKVGFVRGNVNQIILRQGDNFHIPPGRLHQMIALEDTELFEFSTQDFPEDSIRIIKGD